MLTTEHTFTREALNACVRWDCVHCRAFIEGHYPVEYCEAECEDWEGRSDTGVYTAGSTFAEVVTAIGPCVAHEFGSY